LRWCGGGVAFLGSCAKAVLRDAKLCSSDARAVSKACFRLLVVAAAAVVVVVVVVVVVSLNNVRHCSFVIRIVLIALSSGSSVDVGARCCSEAMVNLRVRCCRCCSSKP